MLDQVTRIYDFNRVNGLLDKPYDDFLESSFQIEEALEGFDNIVNLGKALTLDNYHHLGKEACKSPKAISRAIVSLAFYDKPLPEIGFREISDLDRLDKHLDSIVYDIGSIAKLGLTPDQLLQALSIVMDANEAKNGCSKDELGKLMKPENFPNPEPRLEQLLATRG